MKKEISNSIETHQSPTLCKFIPDFKGFNLITEDDDVYVEVLNLSGSLIDKFTLNKNETHHWDASKHQINNQVIFVKVKCKRTGSVQCFKSVLMR